MSKSKREKRKLKFKTKIIMIITLLLIAGVVVFAGYKLNWFSDKVNKKIDKIVDKVVEPEKKITIVNPDSKSRPYAVMINNAGVARKYQSGLDKAYIIYEMIVEGGLTRMMALYKDVDVERIGTVRSSRHYYLDYAMENDAIYVHWGWSPQAQSDISSYKIQNINGLTYGTKYFWKDKSLKVSTEHTAYTSTALIKEAVSKLKYRNETTQDLLLNYNVDPIDLSADATLIDANNISIKYSSSVTDTYEYDTEKQVYKRSVNGTPHTDYLTNEQYTFKNIITYQVSNSTISGDQKGRQTFDNVGSGEGYYITNGKAVTITWSKSSRNSQTVYKLKSTGEELKVNDGNTFIQIQPTGQSITIS